MNCFRGVKGNSLLFFPSHRKRPRNIKRELTSISGVCLRHARGTSAAAFTHSQSHRNVASTPASPCAIHSVPSEYLFGRLASTCHCRNAKSGLGNNSRLFSSASEDNALDASSPSPIVNQKTLAKQPLDDSIEESIFEDDSEYHVYRSEQTIKKSRFIGLARYADDWKDASNFVQNIRTKVHPKARHWCFAYRGSIAGCDENTYDDALLDGASFATSTTITERASDDGEPSGTAGQPMLNALTTETTAPDGLIDVVVVVVRYSGGIKLGAGGLIRAYGGTARMVLQEHSEHQVEVIPKQKLSLSSIQPKHVGVVYDLAAKHGAIVVATNDDYTSFSVTCDSEVVGSFKEGMMDATRGSAVIR